MPNPGSDTQTISKDSALCLACALCCRGIMHDHFRLAPDETTLVDELKLPIYIKRQGDGQTYPALSLPCPLLNDNRCTIYNRRPSPCRSYRCLLLQRYAQGRYSFDECLDIVATAHNLIYALRQQMGWDVPDLRIWDQINSYYKNQQPAAPQSDFETVVKTLWNFCFYQFDPKVAATQYPQPKK